MGQDLTIGKVARLRFILGDAQSCGKARALASGKLALVRARIADLARMRTALEALIKRCDAGRGKVACPIIQSLRCNGAGRPRDQA